MKILHTIPLRDDLQKNIAQYGCLVYRNKHELCIQDVEDADIIIGNIQRKWLAHCHALKYLQLESAGSELYKDVVAKDVILCNASGTFGVSIAEHLLTMTLMLFRNMPYYMHQQQVCKYNPLREVRELKDSRFVIVGVGDIGQQFALRLQALGAYTIGVRKTSATLVNGFDEMYTIDQLDSVLADVDVLCFCVPANAETNLLLDRRRMDLLPQKAIVLNVGRGNVLDENALCQKLNEGTISGAALDVFSKEPVPMHSPLWHAQNMIVTPHVAGTFANAHTYALFYDLVYDNINRYFNGLTLRNSVDRNSGYRMR